MIKRGTAFFALFLFGILFYTCVGVDDQNLGDNYYYLPKYEAKDIGYPGGAIVYKSAEKNIFKEVKIEGEVINVKSDLVYGPFNKKDYQKKRLELGIPDKLKLQNK